MSRRPTISVVVPVYNGAALVAETLDSLLAQTRPADEIIVVDDGSTDATQAVLAGYGNAIRVISQENRGHPGAYHAGFCAATGDYVARCDADDLWERDKLARQAAALEAHPEIDVAFTGAWVFGREERPFSHLTPHGLVDPKAFAWDMYEGNRLCASSTVIRRSLYEQLGPFADRLPCEDYDFWLRALKAGAVFYADRELLVRYRQHGGNVTNNLVAMYRATSMVHMWHADLVDDDRRARGVQARDHAKIGRLLFDRGDEDEARAAFVESVRLRPSAYAVAWRGLLALPGPLLPAMVGSSLSIRRRLSARPR